MQKGLKIMSQRRDLYKCLLYILSGLVRLVNPKKKRELLVKTHGASGSGGQSYSLHGKFKPPKRKF